MLHALDQLHVGFEHAKDNGWAMILAHITIGEGKEAEFVDEQRPTRNDANRYGAQDRRLVCAAAQQAVAMTDLELVRRPLPPVLQGDHHRPRIDRDVRAQTFVATISFPTS